MICPRHRDDIFARVEAYLSSLHAHVFGAGIAKMIVINWQTFELFKLNF